MSATDPFSRPAPHLGDALQWGTLSLAAATATPDLDAAVLLGHIVGASRALLLAYPERLITGERALRLCRSGRAAVARRAGRLSHWPPRVYGPRPAHRPPCLDSSPETELLVELALEDARSRLEGGTPPVVADLGTGSGAIAVALVAHEPRLPRVYAADISTDALALAADNVSRLGVADRVTLLHGDLLAPIPGPVDLLVANLPYVAPGDAEILRPCRAYEPALALFGDEDGLGHLRRLFADLPAYLRPGASIYLEFGYDQRPALVALAQTRSPTAPSASSPTMRAGTASSSPASPTPPRRPGPMITRRPGDPRPTERVRANCSLATCRAHLLLMTPRRPM